MLVAANKPLTTWVNVNLFKAAVVCAAFVAADGGKISAETPPTAVSAGSVKLPESINSIGMKFKLIPAGTFLMGESEVAHEVTLTKPFKMGVHEVTQSQYERLMGVNPSHFKGADNPVHRVSWDDAVDFCRRLSELPAEKKAGNLYRLPTEAEWEYACRAGTTTKYSFGDDESDFGEYGWYRENSGRTTHQVGSKLPNAWELPDRQWRSGGHATPPGEGPDGTDGNAVVSSQSPSTHHP